jgi:hypothetical protein
LVATMIELANISSADHSGRSSIPVAGNKTPQRSESPATTKNGPAAWRGR